MSRGRCYVTWALLCHVSLSVAWSLDTSAHAFFCYVKYRTRFRFETVRSWRTKSPTFGRPATTQAVIAPRRLFMSSHSYLHMAAIRETVRNYRVSTETVQYSVDCDGLDAIFRDSTPYLGLSYIFNYLLFNCYRRKQFWRFVFSPFVIRLILNKNNSVASWQRRCADDKHIHYIVEFQMGPMEIKLSMILVFIPEYSCIICKIAVKIIWPWK